MKSKVNYGTYKDGVVVLDDKPEGLEEGTRVGIVAAEPEPYPGFWEEFRLWDRASDQAWAMIDEMEREDEREASADKSPPPAAP
jgi:hypothetical protein